MEYAYIFLLVALVFGAAFGVMTGRAPWIAGAICAAVSLAGIVGSFATRPGWQSLDALLFVSPFLVGVALGYFTAGYAGAALGNRFSLSKSPADRRAALLALGKRATVIATVVLVLLCFSYVAHVLNTS